MHSVAMSARVSNTRILRMTVISPTASRQPLTASVRLSHLGKTRECQQVAAVCYRLRRGLVEFLLVQTRGSGRWIFPKGSAEPGLTHAQAAAIEAFEEAGVHGRIEESAFVRYACHRQSNRRNGGRSGAKTLVVSAHLCEVRRLCNPKESNRNRTWFSIEDTTRRLREGRKNEDGKEFARVVNLAVERIKQLQDATDMAVDHPRPHTLQDELHKVQFEAPPDNRHRFERPSGFPPLANRTSAREILPCEVLPFISAQQSNRSGRVLANPMKAKALGMGAKSGF